MPLTFSFGFVLVFFNNLKEINEFQIEKLFSVKSHNMTCVHFEIKWLLESIASISSSGSKLQASFDSASLSSKIVLDLPFGWFFFCKLIIH